MFHRKARWDLVNYLRGKSKVTFIKSSFWSKGMARGLSNVIMSRVGPPLVFNASAGIEEPLERSAPCWRWQPGDRSTWKGFLTTPMLTVTTCKTYAALNADGQIVMLDSQAQVTPRLHSFSFTRSRSNDIIHPQKKLECC